MRNLSGEDIGCDQSALIRTDAGRAKPTTR